MKLYTYDSEQLVYGVNLTMIELCILGILKNIAGFPTRLNYFIKQFMHIQAYLFKDNAHIMHA